MRFGFRVENFHWAARNILTSTKGKAAQQHVRAKAKRGRVGERGKLLLAESEPIGSFRFARTVGS